MSIDFLACIYEYTPSDGITDEKCMIKLRGDGFVLIEGLKLFIQSIKISNLEKTGESVVEYSGTGQFVNNIGQETKEVDGITDEFDFTFSYSNDKVEHAFSEEGKHLRMISITPKGISMSVKSFI